MCWPQVGISCESGNVDIVAHCLLAVQGFKKLMIGGGCRALRQLLSGGCHKCVGRFEYVPVTGASIPLPIFYYGDR